MLKQFITLGIILLVSSRATAFFFTWGSQEQQQPNTRYYYHKRLLQGPAYLVDPDKRPALPVQVPLQAQLAPIPGNVQNVQLVPCLCPVAQDNNIPFLYDNVQHGQQLDQHLVQNQQQSVQNNQQ